MKETCARNVRGFILNKIETLRNGGIYAEIFEETKSNKRQKLNFWKQNADSV